MSKQPDINYEVINSLYKKRTDNVEPVHIKAWIKGVALEDEARQQLVNLTTLPFIYKHVAVMPDAHMGKGSTIGSVIPTKSAIIPASVGVDLGCGMMAVRTSLTAHDLPDDLSKLRLAIERSVPHGRTNNGARGDRGAWGDLSGGTSVKKSVESAWSLLLPGFKQILESHPKIDNGHVNSLSHLGTLGTGNHFIEICLDEADNVWVMLHSGSRGVGNRIGTYFIELAKKEMEKQGVRLIDTDLAYLKEGSKYFDDYFHAVSWAQKFAFANREIMMANTLKTLRSDSGVPSFQMLDKAINCHHNYVEQEEHFGETVYVTRKGAVRAGVGDLGIIPGSMGVGSYIVRGKGNPDSFNSCSHGAGRAMSRTRARQEISLEKHIADTKGVECRKDMSVIDESPSAYKPLDKVMAAQRDLVTILHRLRPVLCVKG